MKFTLKSLLVLLPIWMLAGALPLWAQTPSSVPTSASAPATSPSSTPALPAPKVAEPKEVWCTDDFTETAKVNLGSLDSKNSGYLFKVELTPIGGAVYTVKLADYFSTIADKKLFTESGSEEAYEKALAQKTGPDAAKYLGHYSLLNPVTHAGAITLPMETRTIRILRSDKAPLDFTANGDTWKHVKTTTDADGAQRAVFSWTLYRAATPSPQAAYLRIEKTYIVRKADYSIGFELKIVNLSTENYTVSVEQYGPTGVPEELHSRSDSREAVFGKMVNSAPEVDFRRISELAKMTLDKPEVVGTSKDAQSVLWIGEVNKYFASMLYLYGDVSGRLEALEYDARWFVVARPESSDPNSRTFVTGVTLPDLKVAAGKDKVVRFDFFAGPKQRDMLEGMPPYGKELYKQLNYHGTVNISGSSCSWCTFSWLTFGMMWLLEAFYKVFHNFGVAIILLVIMVRLVLHPLTKKSQVSMMKMQKLGPAMEALKAKHANDKETLNREMMKAYKEQGAIPILGCLPMFLQMPIWIALWTALNIAIELRQAPFLPVWITDLSAPDALFTFPPITLPGISAMVGPIWSLNVLPLLLTVGMVLQSKLTPTATKVSTPEQKTQQKMMMFLMPIMMLFIFYNAPSGLTLYIMASTFAGVIEQYVIRKHIREKEAAEASSETRIDAPGKGPRGNRSKKPKGPNWFKQG